MSKSKPPKPLKAYTPPVIEGPATAPTADEGRVMLARIYRRAVAERERIYPIVMDERFSYELHESRDLAHVLAAVEQNIVSAAVALGVTSLPPTDTPAPPSPPSTPSAAAPPN